MNVCEKVVSGQCWIETVLCDVYMDGVLPKVNARVLEQWLGTAACEWWQV